MERTVHVLHLPGYESMWVLVFRTYRNCDELLGVRWLDSRGREEVWSIRERILDELHRDAITKTNDRDPTGPSRRHSPESLMSCREISTSAGGGRASCKSATSASIPRSTRHEACLCSIFNRRALPHSLPSFWPPG